jgi:hypothetical protein
MPRTYDREVKLEAVPMASEVIKFLAPCRR